ncbi:hypothetical protein [Oerskovia paurometabola]|uniref:hypothetical protein n=1 Tax=Oerskovia paurometabola TaxID=162170 RepID=UPI0038061E15
MAGDFRVEGAQSLAALAKAMRRVGGGKELRKQLLSALREAGEPVADEMRTALAAKLPSRGGAAKLLTKKKKTFAVRNRLSDSAKQSAGVRIVSTDATHDYQSLERRGALRHPAHPGRRPRRSWRWVEQKVPTAGVLEGVLSQHEPRLRGAVEAAMVHTAQSLAQAIEREV